MLMACLALLAASPAWALDQVSLQLKWKHQFQFAGYYAALEKGFYRDAGLDVEIREGGPDVDAAKAVAAGQADFGVCTSSVLLDRANGRNLVVLGVIFQHSAAIILVPRRAGIASVSELKGRRLMDTPGSDDIAAMLKREGVDYASLPRVPHNGDPRDLLNGKADAMVAYSTNEPFVLDQLGAPYQTFSPRAYRYRLLRRQPLYLRAAGEGASRTGTSLYGGQPEGLAVRIVAQGRNRRSDPAALLRSRRAATPCCSRRLHTEALVQPDLIELGYQNAQRWKNIADTYRDLGMLSAGSEPEWQIFRPDDSGVPGWLKYTLLGLGALVIMAALVWLWIAVLGRRLKAALGTPKLSVVMSVLFVCLSIPILIFILLYNYHTNSVAIVSTLHEEVAKTNQASIESTENLIQPVASTLRLLASAAAADPAFFRTEQSRDFLYQALTSAPQIDAAYVSFEDGYHRVVTRIDDDRRRSDPQITPTANWHSSYIDDFSAGKNRARHRTFFDTWPHVVGRYDAASTLDVRTLPGYQAAKESGSLVVTEPSINPDTGYPIIFVRFPIVRNGEFIGCATANITLDILSRFLLQSSHQRAQHDDHCRPNRRDNHCRFRSAKECSGGGWSTGSREAGQHCRR